MMHGGKSTGPKDRTLLLGNKNASQHNIFSVGLLPGEHEVFEEITVGDLDNMIKMANIRLRRAYAAQAEWERQRLAGNEQLELMEVELNGTAGRDGSTTSGRVKRIRRKHDFGAEIRSTERNISTMERDRAFLLASSAVTDLKRNPDDLRAQLSSDILRAFAGKKGVGAQLGVILPSVKQAGGGPGDLGDEPGDEP